MKVLVDIHELAKRLEESFEMNLSEDSGDCLTTEQVKWFNAGIGNATNVMFSVLDNILDEHHCLPCRERASMRRCKCICTLCEQAKGNE